MRIGLFEMIYFVLYKKCVNYNQFDEFDWDCIIELQNFVSGKWQQIWQLCIHDTSRLESLDHKVKTSRQS